MKERLTPKQIEIAQTASRSFERAWRVYSNPRKHSLSEVMKACDYIVEQRNNIDVAVKAGVEYFNIELYDRIFMGIFHHDINPPLEYKFKLENKN